MFDDLQQLLIASGYVGIFLWAFIEGEVGMVLAGSLAQQGYFSYKWVAVTAFMGGFFGDQFYFWLGATMVIGCSIAFLGARERLLTRRLGPH